MNLLLVDNSNRTTKLAVGDAQRVLPDSRQDSASASLSPEVLDRMLAAGPEVAGMVFCSVTADGAHLLTAWANARGLPSLELGARTVPMDLSHYPVPETIGADRLANAVAANARFPRSAVIAVDAGTAITFNVVVPDLLYPRFLGGAIAPGLAAFTSWLHTRTARLPEIVFPESPVPAIGDGTIAAMQSAARHGLTGFLREILRAQQAECGAAEIVLTGTDAVLLAPMLGQSVTIEPMLTLDGLRISGILHPSAFRSC